jgi:hypothetical protein
MVLGTRTLIYEVGGGDINQPITPSTQYLHIGDRLQVDR